MNRKGVAGGSNLGKRQSFWIMDNCPQVQVRNNLICSKCALDVSAAQSAGIICALSALTFDVRAVWVHGLRL